jgi:hypothetical protein
MTIGRDGDTIRVDYPIRWYGRIVPLLLLGAGLGLLFCVYLRLAQDLSGEDAWSDNLPGLLLFTVLGLGFGLPGLMMLTFRYFVVIEKIRGSVTVTRRFGALKFRQLRKLADFKLISVTDDGDKRGTIYDVALCGGKGTRPIVLSGFSARRAADDFPLEMGGALRLPFKDVVGTEPDDPDLDTEAEAEGANAPRRGRKAAVVHAA